MRVRPRHESRHEDELPAQMIRYQLANHQGSTCLELDDDARLIAYEEYLPFGSASFQSGRSLSEVNAKRYRHLGMERDEESGLSYHGARYFASWLGRWISSDPAGPNSDGTNTYSYVANNPTNHVDITGLEGEKGQYQWSKSAEENEYRHEFLTACAHTCSNMGFR